MILTEELISSIKKISLRHGARNIRLFGSMARGDSCTDSDLDLLVDMEDGRSLFDLMEIQDELSRSIGRKVDIVTERSLNRHIREKVLGEAIPL
jgi:predicted nucleotidyltransferase